MNKEGSIRAPIRHPVDFDHQDFLDPKKLDDEMRRVFDICHGCRRCFNLCDSFPKLFDFVDETETGEVSSLSSKKFGEIVDACTLCDMCFMTKCPYVPPHEFNLDFPHLMFRYRMYQKKAGKLPKIPLQLAQIDRNAKIYTVLNKECVAVQVNLRIPRLLETIVDDPFDNVNVQRAGKRRQSDVKRR